MQIRGQPQPPCKRPAPALPCPRREPRDRVEGERRVIRSGAIGMQDSAAGIKGTRPAATKAEAGGRGDSGRGEKLQVESSSS